MRWTIAFFAVALIAMQLEFWFGDDRRPGLKALRADVAEQSAINQALAERNADLEAEIINLRESREAAEEIARSELGLIHPEETYFQIVETPASAID
jgi:cell division protein FtsB